MQPATWLFPLPYRVPLSHLSCHIIAPRQRSNRERLAALLLLASPQLSREQAELHPAPASAIRSHLPFPCSSLDAARPPPDRQTPPVPVDSSSGG
jgi:hypothetical protein